MRSVVKLFIEEQIDLINQQNWHELFSLWYEHYSTMPPYNEDYKRLKEFFDVLESAGLGDVKSESEDARKGLIIQYLNDYIDEMIACEDDVVRTVGALNSLNSRLFFGLIEMRNIFIETCEQRQLEPTSETKGSFKLK